MEKNDPHQSYCIRIIPFRYFSTLCIDNVYLIFLYYFFYMAPIVVSVDLPWDTTFIQLYGMWRPWMGVSCCSDRKLQLTVRSCFVSQRLPETINFCRTDHQKLMVNWLNLIWHSYNYTDHSKFLYCSHVYPFTLINSQKD